MAIYIISLESLPNRYTCEWLEGIPNGLINYAKKNGTNLVKDVDVINILGDGDNMVTTPGAFINFAGTNKWKSEQMIKLSVLISEDKVKDGDKFLFTDAWNPTVLQLKYMLDLLDIKAEIHGIQHAGAYDENDFLGRVQNKTWLTASEKAMFWAFDKIYFATQYHIDKYVAGVLANDLVAVNESKNKLALSGQPHEELIGRLTSMQTNSMIFF
jgi:hypothetical protein